LNEEAEIDASFLFLKEVIKISIFDGDYSIIVQKRLGNASDPFVPISELVKISNGVGVLREIPNRASGLTVANGSTPLSINDATLNQLPTPTIVSIQWDQCYIYADTSLEGVTLNVNYVGEGNIYISSNRIFTKNSGSTVTQTLNDLTSAASNFVHRGEYSSTTVYLTYNLVSYLGITYIYTASTSSTSNSPDVTNSAYWTKVAGNINKGVYSTSTTYDAGDIVEDSTYHNVYQSKVNSNLNQSLTNTAKWQMLLSVQSTIDTLNTTNTNVTNAESSRVTTESSRVSAESGRVGAESSRVSAESGRVSAESTRSGNESTRQSQETTRVSQESSRQTTINNINAAISNLKHKGAYDSATVYVENNSVNYNGSTYRCILTSTGNLPSDTTYWTLEALKGANGAGTVAEIISTNGDIGIGGTPQNPTLTLNSGTGANQIVKRNANSEIETNTVVLGAFKIQYNSINNTLDFIYG
jgi:hypothetical protein